MARRDKKTGKFVSSVAEDDAEMNDAIIAAQKLDSIHKKIFDSLEKNNTALKEGGTLTNILSGKTLENKLLTELQTKALKEKRLVSKEEVDDIKDQVSNQKKLGGAINQILPGAVGFMTNIEDAARGMSGLLGPAALAVAIFTALAKLALGAAKSITDTRKELGVSVATAAKLNAQNRLLGFQAKLYGLEMEDVKNAQAAIRKDLGASVQEAANLSISFARTAAATGQTSEELSSTLSLMESISSSSREVLLNQIRTNAAMIEAAGIAPSLIMKDIAQNAEFFATFAKDGGKNLIGAGIAARKLGLDMSAVKGITESLLDFETSIEASQTASLLLGRQINTDRARQLAFAGDQKGQMKEIVRLAGSEAEFTAMNSFQREALAKALGMNVEGLARTVRNNTAGGTASAVGAAMGDGGNPLLNPTMEIRDGINKLNRNYENR